MEPALNMEKGTQQKAKDVLSIVNQGDFPAAMEHVSKLMAAAVSSNSSARDISRIILKDLGLTNKVLKIANSAYYSMRSGGSRKISTITGAVVLLGFKAVRDIAASVSLFDYLAKKTKNLRELKRMFAQSFAGATFASQISRAINYPDEEEAYLCGLFHDLGRMIAAFMVPEMYTNIQQDVADGISENQAAKKHLGMTVRELGITVAKGWNFSDKICMSMEGMPKEIKGQAKDIDILRAVASMGHLISRATCSGGNSDQEISRIVALYSKILPINEDIIDEAKAEAEKRAAELMAPLGIDISVLRPEDVSGEPQRPEEPPEPEAFEAPSETNQAEIRKEAILNASVEITESILKGCDLDSIFMIIIESMQNGLGFDYAFLAVLNPARTVIKARYGVGDRLEEYIPKFALPLKESSGIMASSVIWGKDMIVTSEDYKLPPGDKLMLSALGASTMAALPILIDGRSIGTFVVAKRSGAIDAGCVRQSGKLRDYATLAIESIRNRMKK